MAGSSVSRASLRAAGMPRVRQVSEAPLSDRLGEMDAAPYSRYRRRPAPPAEAELQEESRNGSGPCAGFMWETDRADTDSERIRQRSGRNSSFDRAFPGVFPYARSVPFREHPPGQTRRALYEDMAYYSLKRFLNTGIRPLSRPAGPKRCAFYRPLSRDRSAPASRCQR